MAKGKNQRRRARGRGFVGHGFNALNHPSCAPRPSSSSTRPSIALATCPTKAPVSSRASATLDPLAWCSPVSIAAFRSKSPASAYEARKHGYDLLIAKRRWRDDILEDHYLRYFMGTQMSGVMVQPMASPDWHPAMTKMPVPMRPSGHPLLRARLLRSGRQRGPGSHHCRTCYRPRRTILSSSAEQHLCNSPCASLAL